MLFFYEIIILGKVFMYQAGEEHNHQNQSSRGIKDAKIVTRINELFTNGISKPNKVIDILEAENFTVPAKHKIEYFLRTLRHMKYGHDFDLCDLEEWCEKNSWYNKENKKVDEAFVVSYKITCDDENDEEESNLTVTHYTLMRLIN